MHLSCILVRKRFLFVIELLKFRWQESHDDEDSNNCRRTFTSHMRNKYAFSPSDAKHFSCTETVVVSNKTKVLTLQRSGVRSDVIRGCYFCSSDITEYEWTEKSVRPRSHEASSLLTHQFGYPSDLKRSRYYWTEEPLQTL